jgi:hypothetical protein
MTSTSDGTFTGNRPSIVTNEGDSGTDMQSNPFNSQRNDYTNYGEDGMGVKDYNRKTQFTISDKTPAAKKRQLTQAGWDGSFVGIKIPSPLSSDGDGGGSQQGSFSPPSFAGFNRQDEGGVIGPNTGPSSGNPGAMSGGFPGDGGDTGFDGFNRQSER